MKLAKIIVFVILLIGAFNQIEAQKKGSTATPYSTEGWDVPVDSTKWFKLFIFRLLSNPGGWHNLNMAKIDSLFNALVVFTDTTQYIIEDDTLKPSPHSSGMNSFSGTAQVDTNLVVGMDSSDVVLVSPRESAPSANDRLWVVVKNGKFIVNRPSSGTSDLKYNWIWRRRY